MDKRNKEFEELEKAISKYGMEVRDGMKDYFFRCVQLEQHFQELMSKFADLELKYSLNTKGVEKWVKDLIE